MSGGDVLVPLVALSIGLVGGTYLFTRSAEGSRRVGAAAGLLGNIFWGFVAISLIIGFGLTGAILGTLILLGMVAVGWGNADALTKRDLRAQLVNGRKR